MKCSYCGKEISQNMKYCPACGKELRVETESGNHGVGATSGKKGRREKNKKEKKETKRGRKVKLVLIVILVTVLLAGIGCGTFYFTSSARDVVKQIEKGNTTTAQQVYTNKVKDNFIQENLFKKFAEEDCNSALDQFREGMLDYEEAADKLAAYGMLSADELDNFLTEKSETLDKLNDSMLAYVEAEKLYSDGNYAEALEEYSHVIEEDDNFEDAQTKLSSCVENYTKEILEGTKQVETIEEYEEAIETLTIALKIVDDNQELSDRLEELEDGYATLLKSEALTNGTQYIKDGKFQELFELLEKAAEKNSGDTELSNLQKTAEEEYVKVVQAAVDEYLAADQYDQAIKYLQEAVKVLDTNSTLNELLEKVQSSVPIELRSLKISESNLYEAGEELTVVEDSIGNVYSPGNLYKLSPYRDDAAYVTYYVKGEYTRIKGTIAVADDSEQEKMGNVSILDENGKILYTSGDMSRTTVPKSIDIDISGVEWITITCENKDGWDFRVFLADWVLFKN